MNLQLGKLARFIRTPAPVAREIIDESAGAVYGQIAIFDWEAGRKSEPPDLVAEVSYALQLIEEWSPTAWGRVCKSIGRVIIENRPAHSYYPEFAAAYVDREAMVAEGWPIAALAVLDAATVATILARGIVDEESTRQQIQRICAKRGLAFLRSLEGTQDVTPWVEACRKRSDMRPATDAEIVDIIRRRLIEGLRAEGVPRIAIRFLTWVHERNMRRNFGPAWRPKEHGAADAGA